MDKENRKDFNHDKNYHKSQYQLIKKEALVGPVTALTLETCSYINDNNGHIVDIDVCLLARGPYVQIIPLRLSNDGVGDDRILNDNGDNNISPSFIQQKNRIFTHLVFNSQFENESGTVHGIYKVDNFSNEKLSLWAFYGGRKLSFALIDSKLLSHNESALGGPVGISLDIVHLDAIQKPRSSLCLTDWIWDIRVICPEYKSDQAKEVKILAAVGLAQNTVEIWSFTSMSTSESLSNDLTLKSQILRKIVCEKRCITYSLSFYGWKNSCKNMDLEGDDLILAVGSGTVTNQILLWNAIDVNDGNEIVNACRCNENDIANNDKVSLNIQMRTKNVSHILSGHVGVIYSVRFGRRGIFVASTSDDRTVRLWKRNDDLIESSKVNRGYDEMSIDAQLITYNQKSHYQLVWTGFGHSARVWDCSFISLTTNGNDSDGIISSGEDGTLKIWQIENGQIISSMKGHACQSIWKLCSSQKYVNNVHHSIAVSGANDGSVNLWNLGYHVRKHDLECKRCILSDNEHICAMTFYSDEGKQKLLLATKEGILVTLDPFTMERTKTGFWARCNGEDISIQPQYGSCIAVSPNNDLALIGTTKGDIVLVAIHTGTTSRTSCSARQYLAIQSLCWLDSSNILAFHVKGIVVWWEIITSSDINQLRLKRVLNMNVAGITIGVTMSHYFDPRRNFLFIGDSRGNIAMFGNEKIDTSLSVSHNENDIVEQVPIDVLVYAHRKEHVTCIISSFDGRGILSVGNDGCLQESTIIRKGKSFKLHKSLSRPISDLSGVSYLWWSKSGALIAGGYHGNDFVVVDVTTSLQLLNIDTGGRNRRISLQIDLLNLSSLQYHLAVCVSNKRMPFEIILHSSPIQSLCIPLSLPYKLSVPYHSETVYDLAVCSFSGVFLVASGSNDCAVKLSVISNSSLTLLRELPPHESCIRALSFSYHVGLSSAILVVCGGKLITTVYRLNRHENGDISVHFLCNNKLPIQQSIDHRMNAVKAVPLLDSDKEIPKHVVLSGDSDGCVHLTIVTEELGQSRRAESRFLTKDLRPVLSIDMIMLSDSNILACVGTTAGYVTLWILHHNTNGEIESSKSPTMTFQAHSMGANSISAILMNSNTNNDVFHVMICSGGDDQRLSVRLLSILIPFSKVADDVKITHLAECTIFDACASAIKGVVVSGDSDSGYRVYTSGYDQRLAMWDIIVTEYDDNVFTIELDLLSTTPVDVKDINTLCGCVINSGMNDNRLEYLIAGGEGMEVFMFDSSISSAASALKNCNKLLITCGSGFSADSGLATYEVMPEKYKNMCNPLRLVDSLTSFQSFWMNFAHEYDNTFPHKGYHILAKLCGGGKLKNLQAVTDIPISPWWIYSSNVDGLFGLFDCFKGTICEIHGRALDFRCARATGYSGGIRRRGKIWDQWNHDCLKSPGNDKCNSAKIKVFAANQYDCGNFTCRECKMPMRPNVLLFHDSDENVLNDIQLNRNVYQEWEAIMEQQIVERSQHLVILELGAGENVTAVRDETEEVFMDVSQRLNRNSNSKGRVTLIRVNTKESKFKGQPTKHSNCIHVTRKAEDALLSMDQALGQH